MTDVSLERLVSLAARRDLVDDWRFAEGPCILLRVGTVELTLKEPHARAYLWSLIRRHDRCNANQGQAQDDR